MAVAIKPRNEGMSYTEMFKRAKEKVSLVNMSIGESRIQHVANSSGLIIEIPSIVQSRTLKEAFGEDIIVLW